MDDFEAPWFKFYDTKQTDYHLDYPDISMYEMVRRAAIRMHDVVAYDFFGRKTKYSEFLKKIDKVAAACHKLGIKKGDRVLICMPNAPQALMMIYAVSKLGAVSVIIHPLSARNEIKYYLNNSNAKYALVLDAFVKNFTAVKDQTPLEKIIVTSIADEFNFVTKLGYLLTKARKVPKYTRTEFMIKWKFFVNSALTVTVPEIEVKGKDPAMILYSGGTTGDSKGILLSNLNLNATSMETLSTSNLLPCKINEVYSDKMIEFVHKINYRVLSVMPIFHGFGFGVGIHSFLTFGGTCILVPQFTPESYAMLVKNKKPNFIAGVPTLFEKMMSFDSMKNADLSMLKGVFCGGDSLSIELREKFNKFLEEHGSQVPVREGYGLTECVTVACLTPAHEYREGGIGVPLPDVLFKIVKYGTQEDLPFGEEGEICISGPNVMIGYVNDDETTKIALQVHKDGRTWLHTGDAGVMDSDGFVYFKQRYKRIIVSSGYNIYPSQIENAINKFPGVKMSCAIGIPDPVRKQRVKVYIVLEKGIVGDDKLKKRLIAHCKLYVAAYAVPKLFEFIDEMPMTKVGKIAFLEVEEIDRKKRENQ